MLSLLVSSGSFAMSSFPANQPPEKDDHNLIVGYAGSGVKNLRSLDEKIVDGLTTMVRDTWDFALSCRDVALEPVPFCDKDTRTCEYSDEELITRVSCYLVISGLAGVDNWYWLPDEVKEIINDEDVKLAADIVKYTNQFGVPFVEGFLSNYNVYNIYAESILINHDDSPEATWNYSYKHGGFESNYAHSNRAPAFIDFNSQIYMAYIDKNKKIKVSTRNIEKENSVWLSQGQVNSHKSSDKVSMAVFKGYLYMTFKGTSSNKIYVTRTKDGKNWEQARTINNFHSAYSPTLSVAKSNGREYLVAAFRGNRDKKLYFTRTVDGYNWDNANGIGDQSSNAPYIAYHNGKLYMAFKGASTRNIYIKSSSDAGQTWSRGFKFNSSYRSDRAPAIASHKGFLYMAFKGISTNNVYWTRSSIPDNSRSWNSAQVFKKNDSTTKANHTSGSLTLYSSDLKFAE